MNETLWRCVEIHVHGPRIETYLGTEEQARAAAARQNSHAEERGFAYRVIAEEASP